MKIKLMSSLLVFSLIIFFSTICRNVEDAELLKSHLNAAINESNLLEIARIMDKLVKLDVDPKTLPIEESINLIMGRIGRAYNWETITGEEIVRLCGPLEGILNGTWREHMIRGAYFWGLMETGQREKAISLWEKSEKQVHSLLDSPSSLSSHLDLPNEERAFRSATSQGVIYFAIGFVSSKNSHDRRQGVELAKKHYRYLVETFKEVVKSSQLANPIAQAKITQLLPHESLFAYCLVESGLAMDKSANPYLEDQPETTIRFELVRNTGLEECGVRIADEEYNRIALGDYDNDGYADVLVPGHGMWRNLEGRGKFTRVDDELGLDIKGICGAFADVDNDGLVDVIVAGPEKVGVSLQTEGRIFRPVINPANRTVENPGGIGLFDGDGDGLIDVYVSGYESQFGTGGLPDVALRNQGDGTFENVTEAWGFTGDDIEQCGQGVSPGDYDDDGRTDIYISNYRLDRNTLWRNVSEEDRPAFVQCADAPWFGDDQRPEAQVGVDRGVEGLQTVLKGTTYWGHTSGAAWGDLNGDGTLDIVCANLSHPRFLAMNPPFIMDLSRVYLNIGHDFQDHTVHAGLMFRETTTDPLLADFNNDGHLDLSMTNCYRVWVNQLYEGVGDGSFREVTFRTGAFACDACGQAAADFDNDGDLDWFVIDGKKGLLLYENKLIDGGRIPDSANWIELKLHGGNHVNSMAYGARVTVKANGKVYVREVAGMRGYSSCDDQVVHIGLGAHTGKVNVEVRWMGDKIQEFSELDVNKRHEISVKFDTLSFP
jgi:hypothetical protein